MLSFYSLLGVSRINIFLPQDLMHQLLFFLLPFGSFTITIYIESIYTPFIFVLSTPFWEFLDDVERKVIVLKSVVDFLLPFGSFSSICVCYYGW